MHIVTSCIDVFSGISIISELVVEVISHVLLEEEHNLRGGDATAGPEASFISMNVQVLLTSAAFSSCALTSILMRLWLFLPYLT